MNIIKQILNIILAIPFFIVMWLFSQFIKLRLWMKGY